MGDTVFLPPGQDHGLPVGGDGLPQLPALPVVDKVTQRFATFTVQPKKGNKKRTTKPTLLEPPPMAVPRPPKHHTGGEMSKSPSSSRMSWSAGSSAASSASGINEPRRRRLSRSGRSRTSNRDVYESSSRKERSHVRSPTRSPARSFRSGYSPARSSRSGVSPARSSRSGLSPARSSRSGISPTRSRSGVSPARSIVSKHSTGRSRKKKHIPPILVPSNSNSPDDASPQETSPHQRIPSLSPGRGKSPSPGRGQQNSLSPASCRSKHRLGAGSKSPPRLPRKAFGTPVPPPAPGEDEGDISPVAREASEGEDQDQDGGESVASTVSLHHGEEWEEGDEGKGEETRTHVRQKHGKSHKHKHKKHKSKKDDKKSDDNVELLVPNEPKELRSPSATELMVADLTTDVDTLNTRYDPKIGGIKTFAINKHGITRAVLNFRRGPPEARPLTLVFHYPSCYITHRYILDTIKNQIHFLPQAAVLCLQFIDRNVLLGTQGLDNRWQVTVNCQEARDELLRSGLSLFNRRILLRRYDDIMAMEYAEYQRYVALQNKIYARLTGDTDTGDITSTLMMPSFAPSTASATLPQPAMEDTPVVMVTEPPCETKDKEGTANLVVPAPGLL